MQPFKLKVYAASRASIPERVAMWQRFREIGRKSGQFEIISSWIDEAGPDETADFRDLWKRIVAEIEACDRLVLYAKTEDFPLKGALIEAGIAFGLGKPVYVCLPGVVIEKRSCRPIGSWIAHPNVKLSDITEALTPMTPDKNSVNPDDPLTNMYGCYPCPMCGSKYRYPWERLEVIACDDCGDKSPIVKMPEEQH